METDGMGWEVDGSCRQDIWLYVAENTPIKPKMRDIWLQLFLRSYGINPQSLMGREAELAGLKHVSRSGKSEFIAVYGRKMGKTLLIREAFKNRFSFYLSGTAKASGTRQLLHFQKALIRSGMSGAGHSVPDNWFTAFHRLSQVLESSVEPRKIVFLDEVQWLNAAESDFIQALDYFWNSFASGRDEIVLVVCGSPASWIINNLIRNRGGLHNRLTLRIHLQPFNLRTGPPPLA